MSWVLNKLEKITKSTYLPGTPGVPGNPGTAGHEAYCYWKDEETGGDRWYSCACPPTGWDHEDTYYGPDGSSVTFSYGGYRYFDGIKASLVDVAYGVEYRYQATGQTIRYQVCVAEVPPVPATPGIPATPAQQIQNLNLGWNTGARGPDGLAVNEAVTWRFPYSNVGAVVGVTLATDPQDNGYAGMALSVMATSGSYRIYRGPTVISGSFPYNDSTKFSLARTNTGTIEVYVNGGLVHTEVLALDVIVDTSLYSGGDQIWDTEEISLPTLERTSGAGAVTLSNAVGDGTKIKVTKAVLLGTAGAVTRSDAVCGAVLVNGEIYTSGGAITLSNGVSLAGLVVVEKTITAAAPTGALTNSDADSIGDVATGVGISTRGGSANVAFLPLTAAAGVAGVNQGWTGNYQGDSVKMLPMSIVASGGLAAPVIGIGECIMAPMACDAVGLTGETSTSSNMSMRFMMAVGSSEVTYGYGNVVMHPMTGLGSDGLVDDSVPSVVLLDYIAAHEPTVKLVYASKILEPAFIGSLVQTFYNPTIDIVDEVAALAIAQPAFIVQLAEQFEIDDSSSATYIMAIAEALHAVGAVQTFYHGAIALLATMLVKDATTAADVMIFSDEISVESDMLSALHRVAAQLDAMTIATAYQSTLTILVEETVEMQAEDTIELTAHLFASLLEHADVYSFLKTPADIAQGWVVNTEGAMPISEYNNYNFNSLTSYKGKLYGTNDAGLYLMGAETDDGAEIAAEIKSLMLDLGTSRLKRMRSAYMGYTSTGDLVLKVRSVDDGQLTEHWYKACPVTAAAPRASRMLIGRGLRSRYWQFELVNVDGADFEIDQIEMHPLITNRRV